MIFGKHDLTLSEKNELALPTAYRPAVGRSAYLTRGFDRNLLLLPRNAFEAIAARLNATSISDPLSRMLRRLFLGGMVEVSVDENGTFSLPDDLASFAGLEQGVVIVGQGEYLEIWSRDHWTKQLEIMQDEAANRERFEKFDLSLA